MKENNYWVSLLKIAYSQNYLLTSNIKWCTVLLFIIIVVSTPLELYLNSDLPDVKRRLVRCKDWNKLTKCYIVYVLTFSLCVCVCVCVCVYLCTCMYAYVFIVFIVIPCVVSRWHLRLMKIFMSQNSIQNIFLIIQCNCFVILTFSLLKNVFSQAEKHLSEVKG